MKFAGEVLSIFLTWQSDKDKWQSDDKVFLVFQILEYKYAVWWRNKSSLGLYCFLKR